MPGPTYVYTPNIPTGPQRLKDSQPLIQANFNAINELIGVNHVDFNTPNTFGKHNFVEFPTAVPTGDTLTTPEVALYSNTGVTSGVPELFFQRNNLGANTGYAFTESTQATTGWTRLPSGIVFKWGQTAAPTGGSPGGGTTVLYSVGPAFNTVFVVIPGQVFTGSYTTTGSNGFAVHDISNPAQFTYSWSGNNSANTFITWFAIGH